MSVDYYWLSGRMHNSRPEHSWQLTNRERAKSPKRYWMYCVNCDQCLVPEGRNCRVCGYKAPGTTRLRAIPK